MQPLGSKYAIITFIYIATTLPPQQTYRTHSPKLRLLLVYRIMFPFSTTLKLHESKSGEHTHV